LPTAGYETFAVVGLEPLAVLEQVRATTDLGEFPLLDLTVRWQADGNYRALATFDLATPEQPTIDVALAADEELWQATVNGRIVGTERIGPGVWRVRLGTVALAQHVELLYRGRIARLPDRWRPLQLPAPRLARLAEDVKATAQDSAAERASATLATTGGALLPRRVVWTVHSPAGFDLGLSNAKLATDAANQDLARLQALATTVARSSDEAGDSSAAERAAWWAAYSGRWNDLRQRWQRETRLVKPAAQVTNLSTPSAVPSTTAAASIGELDRQWSTIAKRFSLAGDEPIAVSLATPAFDREVDDSTTDASSEETHAGDGQKPFRSVLAGSSDLLTIDYVQAASDDLRLRLMTTGIVLALVGVPIVFRSGWFGRRAGVRTAARDGQKLPAVEPNDGKRKNESQKSVALPSDVQTGDVNKNIFLLAFFRTEASALLNTPGGLLLGPAVAGLLAGFGWWLWLRPSALGIGIAAIGMIVSGRRLWAHWMRRRRMANEPARSWR
jgi:hypothetical protein